MSRWHLLLLSLVVVVVDDVTFFLSFLIYSRPVFSPNLKPIVFTYLASDNGVAAGRVPGLEGVTSNAAEWNSTKG